MNFSSSRFCEIVIEKKKKKEDKKDAPSMMRGLHLASVMVLNVCVNLQQTVFGVAHAAIFVCFW